MSLESTSRVVNPYVGPRPFERQDELYFKGRKQEARDLRTMFLSRRLVLLYAPSGAGKTSLLKAKLIPDLENENDFEVLPVARVGDSVDPPETFAGNRFVFNLLASLGICDNADELAVEGLTLNNFLLNLGFDGRRFNYYAEDETEGEEKENKEGSAGEEGVVFADAVEEIKPRALLIDQFEEMFTSHPELEPDRIDFFRQIGEAMAGDPYLHVLFSMRGDYLFRIIPYVHLLPNSLRSRFQLQRLQAAGALQAVCEPAAEAGRPFDRQVAEKLVECLRRVRVSEVPGQGERLLGDFVEAMQLQVVCQQLWQRLDERLANREDKTITMADVDWVVAGQQGDHGPHIDSLDLFVENALADYYEQALVRVLTHLKNQAIEDVDEYFLRRWFSIELITEAGTRDLLARMESGTKGLPETAVAYLDTKLHLIRNEIRAGNNFIELVHDSFVEPILTANRNWQSRLEQRIPWLNTARRYARNQNAELLLTDYNSLRAARRRMAGEAAKGGLPPSTVQFLEAYLDKGEEVYQQRLLQDLPWLNSARQYAETQNPDLLFNGPTLQVAMEQAAKARANGDLPLFADDFLQASLAIESEREKKRQQHELAQQRALANEQKERAQEARKAAKLQTRLRNLGFGFFGVTLILAIWAIVTSVDASSKADELATQASELAIVTTQSYLARVAAENAKATAVVAEENAIAEARNAEDQRDKATTAAADAVAAEAKADALRLLGSAKEALQNDNYSAAMLLSLAANQRFDEGEQLIEAEIETILFAALHQAYPIGLDNTQNAFKASFLLPGVLNIEGSDKLFPGPVAGSVAFLFEDELNFWLPQQRNEIHTIPFSEPVRGTFSVSQDGSKMAIENASNKASVYSVTPDSIADPTEITFSEPGQKYQLDHLAFSIDGEFLAAVFCKEDPDDKDPCKIEVRNLAARQLTAKCTVNLFHEITALSFINPETMVLAGKFNGDLELQTISLTNRGEAPCELIRIAVPESVDTIDNIAFLAEDNVLLTAGIQENGSSYIQWWRVSPDNTAKLENIGELLASESQIISIVPSTEQHSFIILDNNQQLIQYNARSNLNELAGWACVTIGHDLTATEWQEVYPTQSLVTIDFEENYEPVCAEFVNDPYPLHISFAEQTLLSCDIHNAWSKAEDFHQESESFISFPVWALTSLMRQLTVDEPEFIDRGCWDFIESNYGEPVRQTLFSFAKEVDELNAQFDLTENTYEARIKAILDTKELEGYQLVVNTLLKSHYEQFCFEIGFGIACRKLAESNRLTADLEFRGGNISDNTLWLLETEPDSFYSIVMEADDSSLTPYFELLDSDGRPLVGSILSENGRIASLDSFFVPNSQNQSLLIRTMGYYGESSGAFQIRVTPLQPEDFPLGEVVDSNLAQNQLIQFSAEAGQIATVQMRSTDFSLVPSFILLDENGDYLTEGQIFSDNRLALLSAYILPEDGIYYLRPMNATGQISGAYQLFVNLIDPLTLEALPVGEVESGSLQRDPLWKVEFDESAESVNFIRIWVRANAKNEFAPSLVLLNEAGDVVPAFNRMSNNFTTVESIYILSPEETYYLRTGGLNGELEGQYLIRLFSFSIGELMTTGEITTSTTFENEYWYFEGERGDNVTITMDGVNGFDTYLYLYDASGNQVALNDDSRGSLNSQIELRLPDGGIYYIRTAGYAEADGEYELSVLIEE